MYLDFQLQSFLLVSFEISRLLQITQCSLVDYGVVQSLCQLLTYCFNIILLNEADCFVFGTIIFTWYCWVRIELSL